ncbi:MAG TPA: hypothetical protein VHG52_07470, partial [Thermomicrobiales bacterium]|nr:hypothetical protein [Thermomicrobiales bacterium]
MDEYMDNIFGIPMTTIMIVVVSIMILCLLTTGLIAWRNRIIFRMALRNIPRRKAQSVLIMLGLMLSTMIIAAALTTGDTLNNSTRQATFDGLGEVDQTIAFVGESGGEGTISLNNVPISAEIASDLEAAFQGDPDVAAFMPILTVGAPVLNEAAGLSYPS